MRKFLLAASLIMAFGSQVWATSVVIGLRGRTVLVQEYWIDNKPRFAVSNLRDTSIVITVREAVLDGDDGPVAAKWEIGPRNTSHFDGEGLTTTAYISLSVKGEKLGVVARPTKGTTDSKHRVTTYANMNLWGGVYGHVLWFEQDSLVLKGGREIELTLMVRANSGKVAFGSYDSLSFFINQRRDTRIYEYDLPVPLILPRRAECRTLVVTRERDLIIIDTHAEVLHSDIHEVRLIFETPSFDRPTPVIVSGFRSTKPGEGHWITRAILVEQ